MDTQSIDVLYTRLGKIEELLFALNTAVSTISMSHIDARADELREMTFQQNIVLSQILNKMNTQIPTPGE